MLHSHPLSILSSFPQNLAREREKTLLTSVMVRQNNSTIFLLLLFFLLLVELKALFDLVNSGTLHFHGHAEIPLIYRTHSVTDTLRQGHTYVFYHWCDPRSWWSLWPHSHRRYSNICTSWGTVKELLLVHLITYPPLWDCGVFLVTTRVLPNFEDKSTYRKLTICSSEGLESIPSYFIISGF